MATGNKAFNEQDLWETIEVGNKIASFYEELIEAKSEVITALEAENRKLRDLLSEAQSILKEVWKLPPRSAVN